MGSLKTFYTELLFFKIAKIREHLMVCYKSFCCLIGVDIKQEGGSYVAALNTGDVEMFLETASQASNQIA